MLMQEMEQYPELDTTEAILRVATNNVFSAITAVPAEAWEGIDPAKLLKEAGALIRAAGYKRKVDHDLQTDTEAALAANQSLLYTPLGRIVAIRLEDDPEVLQRYTPEQRRIRNAWRQRQAKQLRPADEKVIKAQMAQLQQALRAAFSK